MDSVEARRGSPVQDGGSRQLEIVPAAEGQKPPGKNEAQERYRRSPIHPRPFQTERQRQEAEERGRIYAWSAGIFSKVTHPKYGSVVVPHRSNYSAICCAADAWGCDWSEILDATVTWPDPGDKITRRPVQRPERKERFGELT